MLHIISSNFFNSQQNRFDGYFHLVDEKTDSESELAYLQPARKE